MKLVFLVEETSMRDTLNGLLPRVLPADVTWQCIPHEGKSDLEKSIPRKLRAWKEPDVRFVVLRDQDSADCEKVKTRLVELCRQGGKADVLVRVVCRELESWFIGDFQAVEIGMSVEGLTQLQGKAKFRQPDTLHAPFSELKKLIPSYQKGSGARAIARHLEPSRNRSKSFQAFIDGLRRFAP